MKDKHSGFTTRRIEEGVRAADAAARAAKVANPALSQARDRLDTTFDLTKGQII